MLRLSLILSIFFIPYLLQAKDFQHDLNMVSKSGIKLSVLGKPSLQEKRLSQVKVQVIGDKKLDVLSFDAEMPDHNHGMVVKATVPKAIHAGKEFLIKGVKLHMPGDWLIKIKVKTNKGIEELKAAFVVKP